MTLAALIQKMPARIALVAILQTAVLGAVVGDHAVTLATGREMIVKTEPVDPRDLFRGDYVALRYGMSQVEIGRLAGDQSFEAGHWAYLTFARQGDDWVPIAITRKPPDALGPNQRMLRAKVRYVYEAPGRTSAEEEGRPVCPAPCTTLHLLYGLESYFVPEGTGRALEDQRNEKRLGVVVAVRDNGRAAIKALQLDGKTIAREGLF